MSWRNPTTSMAGRTPHPSTNDIDPGRPFERVAPDAAPFWVDLSSVPDLQRLAGLPVDLLLEGETGCGKDTVARGIHQRQPHACAFVDVNCAAIPESLMESELFGAEAGAFTGATRARGGKIEAAHGGVLYLDEIDSMSLPLQAKLLHVVQYRGSVRLGSNVFRPSHFKLIASTKIPLATLVERGQFRLDLYFRLNTVTLRMPPLREQPERILPTLRRMLHANAPAFDQGRIPALTRDDEAALLAHPWPGNYRELLSCAIRHLCGQRLFADDRPPGASPARDAIPAEEHLSLRERISAFERRLIVVALDAADGNVAKAALQLRMPAQTLHYRIRTLRVKELRPC